MKKYLIYDGRYNIDPDRAVCLEICDSRKEAEESIKDFGDDSVIVEEELTPTTTK